MKHERGWGLIRGIVFLFLAAATAEGCSGDQGGSAPTPTRSELEGMVSGQAAEALDSNGRFVLPSPEETNVPVLTSDQAKALAAIWPKQFGPYFQTYLEQGHGGKIDTYTLAPCGNPLFAESAFELPIAGVPDRYSRWVGSYWLIALCDPSGRPQVSLAIAATATDLLVLDGAIQFPPKAGNEFIPAGIPHGWSGAVAETPENAVARAFLHTKQRITSVPLLVAPNPAKALPQSAVWRLQLEDSTSLNGKSSNRQIRTNEVFAGPRHYMGLGTSESGVDVSVAAAIQPDSVGFSYHINNEAQLRARAYARRRSGIPLELEPTNPRP